MFLFVRSIISYNYLPSLWLLNFILPKVFMLY